MTTLHKLNLNTNGYVIGDAGEVNEDLTYKFQSRFIYSVDVGETMDITNTRTSSTMNHIVTECAVGDKFYVTGKGGASSSGSWYLTDTNYKVLSKGGNRLVMDNLELTPTSDGYLIVNSEISDTEKVLRVYVKTGLAQSIVENDKEIYLIKNDIGTHTEQISAINTELMIPSDADLPLNICHRGLSSSPLPENTIPAFKDRREKGFKYVETDIRKTSDGEWVLLHDSTINRTARNSDGTTISSTISIADITLAQAQTYDFGIYAGSEFAGTKIPTLEDFLKYCYVSELGAVIEVKATPTSEEAVDIADLILKYKMDKRVYLLSSSLGDLKPITTVLPYLPCIVTSSSEWNYVDPSTFPSMDTPYPVSFKTGKNKVFTARLYSGIADMENYIEYCEYFGLYAGVYCPSTEAGMLMLSPRFSLCISQYYIYSDVWADNMTVQ